MKEPITIDELNLDKSQTLESNGLGRMSLGKLLKDNEIKGAKGYNALCDGEILNNTPTNNNPTVTKKVETVTTEIQNFDPMVMNEILRTVKENNDGVDQKLELLQSEISNIKALALEDKTSHVVKDFKNKKNFIYGLTTVSILFGVIIGTVFTDSSVDNQKMITDTVSVSAAAIKRAPAVLPVAKALKQMVTVKFVNMRSKNSPKSKIIQMISPAQTVDVIDRKGGWIQVNYHNKLTGKKTNGYLWEDYLGKIK